MPEPAPADLARLRWDEVCARRLARHRLTAAAAEPVADTVAAICGAHAQVMSAAELAVGLRCAGVRRTDLRQALWQDRTLVKTFGPRGTVHLLPVRDLPMWSGALGGLPVRTGSDGVLLDAAQQDAVVAAIATALARDALTVEELDGAVRSACGPWAGDLVVPAFGGFWPRWRQAVSAAANAGVLCFGPVRGRRTTYTSLAHWLPGFRPAPAQLALSQLLRAYLYAYGPTTSAQFAQWLGAPRRWADQVVAANSAQVQEVELDDGARAWVNAGDTVPGTDPAPGIRLLPYFDPYLVGSHPRPRLFSGDARDRALSGGQAGTFPVLLVDGTVAGVWHQRRSGKRLHVTVEPFVRLSPAHRSQLESEVARVGEILDARPELTMGPVTTGPHA